MSENENGLVRVRDVMRPEVVLVDGLETVAAALRTMKARRAECLVVNKRHEDDEYGMLLLTDVARLVLARDRAPERVNVYEVMVKPVISVRPDMDIRYCARLFDRFGLSRAPVIDADGVVGVVSLVDMVLDLVADS